MSKINYDDIDIDDRLKLYSDAWGFRTYEEYTVRLTKYGPGGSYDHKKGHIIIKVNEKGISSYRDVTEMIIHEIIHIGIEEAIVKRYSLSHREKERIVDCFLEFHFYKAFKKYIKFNEKSMAIDSFLTGEDSWIHLPRQIERYQLNMLSKD